MLTYSLLSTRIAGCYSPCLTFWGIHKLFFIVVITFYNPGSNCLRLPNSLHPDQNILLFALFYFSHSCGYEGVLESITFKSLLLSHLWWPFIPVVLCLSLSPLLLPKIQLRNWATILPSRLKMSLTLRSRIQSTTKKVIFCLLV